MLLAGIGIFLAAGSPAVAAAPDAPAAVCAPTLHPRIAEILYDAAGDDSGREFVELFNPHPVPLTLAGARLEAGDGSGPGRWTLRWTGSAADTVPARGRFVVGGALVLPTPDAVVALDLQNGPDAARVVWPDGQIEGICVGTTAAYDAVYYYNRPTDLKAMQGYGPTLMAGAEVMTMVRSFDIRRTNNTFYYDRKKK